MTALVFPILALGGAGAPGPGFEGQVRQALREIENYSRRAPRMATDKLLGRDEAGDGVIEEIGVSGGVEFTGSSGIQTSAFTGDVSKAAGGTVLTIGAAKVLSAMLRDSAALSVIGRSANSTGVPADIVATAASGAVLRESSSVLGFGTVATAGLANDAVTDAKLRDGAALSVVGRSANSTGDPADIAAGTDHQVLRRSGTALGFGAVNLAQAAAVTGALPVANGGTGQTASIGFRAHKNAVDQGSIANNTQTHVTFDTEVFDDGGYFASSVWTPPAGKVTLAHSAAFTALGVADTTLYLVSIEKNDTPIVSDSKRFSGTGSLQGGAVAVTDKANGTDTYRASVYQLSGSTMAVSGSVGITSFSGSWSP